MYLQTIFYIFSIHVGGIARCFRRVTYIYSTEKELVVARETASLIRDVYLFRIYTVDT